MWIKTPSGLTVDTTRITGLAVHSFNGRIYVGAYVDGGHVRGDRISTLIATFDAEAAAEKYVATLHKFLVGGNAMGNETQQGKIAGVSSDEVTELSVRASVAQAQ